MNKKTIYFFLIIIIITLGVFGFLNRVKIKNWFFVERKNEPIPEAINYEEVINQNQNINIDNKNVNNLTNNQLPNNNDKPVNEPTVTQLPKSFNLSVPFTSQAPHYQWKEMPYKEGCEEAALIILDYYYKNKDFTPDVADEEIVKMANWQIDTWGGHYDLTATQTALMAKEYLGYENNEVIYNPTVEMIKEWVYQGIPVIIPTAGRMLNNPYYTPPGPLYHMLVIKGWTENNFITNDPGLFQKGRDYQFPFQIVMNAIHDWNGGDVNNGQKVMLIIK